MRAANSARSGGINSRGKRAISVRATEVMLYVENIVEGREITPEVQFLLSSTVLCYLMLNFYVKQGSGFLFEISDYSR